MASRISFIDTSISVAAETCLVTVYAQRISVHYSGDRCAVLAVKIK